MRLLLGLLLLLSQQLSLAKTTSKYDDLIKTASRLYLPLWDWRWYRSQLEQESLLNPLAESHVGAKGIAQFMPATWSDMQRELKFNGSRNDAYKSIRAGAYYDKKLRNVWKWKRTEEDRRRLTFASYNAGTGNILKAQQYCIGSRRWEHIQLCLHQVTGGNALETINYVNTIEIRFSKQIGKSVTDNGRRFSFDPLSEWWQTQEKLCSIANQESGFKTMSPSQ
jgi:hypothetical protein